MRNDLPKGYSGWQAVDATPQEDSNGLSQCGPAPLKAIKNGETFVNFETNFVYGEVNADRCTWLCDVNEDESITPIELMERRRDTIGKFISTKAVGFGNFEREDITSLYKYEEGTEDEKKSFDQAFTYTGMRTNRSFMQKALLGETKPNFIVNIEQVNGPTEMGKDIELKVSLTNLTGKAVELSEEPILTVNSTYQLGGIGGTISQHSLDVSTVEESWEDTVLVPHALYKDKLANDGQGFVRAQAIVKVKNEEKISTFSNRLDFAIEIPDNIIDINMSHMKCRLHDEGVSANIIVTNTLPYTLTETLLTVDGHGLFQTASSSIGELKPGYKVETTLTFQPKKVGKFTIMVDVDSAQVKDIKNFVTIEVLPLK